MELGTCLCKFLGSETFYNAFEFLQSQAVSGKRLVETACKSSEWTLGGHLARKTELRGLVGGNSAWSLVLISVVVVGILLLLVVKLLRLFLHFDECGSVWLWVSKKKKTTLIVLCFTAHRMQRAL